MTAKVNAISNNISHTKEISKKRPVNRLAWWIALFISVCIFVLPTTANAAAPKATDAFYVNDFANVLPSDLVLEMTEHLEILYEKTGAQLVFTTVDYTGADTIDTYALNMFNKYKIGSKENNGVLFLFVIKDDDYYLLPGRGFEELFTSSATNNIFEIVEPWFAEKDYTNAVYNAYLSTLSVVEKFYNVDVYADDGGTPEILAPTAPKSSNAGLFLSIITIFILVFGAIYFFSMLFGGIRRIGFGRRRRYYQPYYRRPRFFPRFFGGSRYYYPPTPTPRPPQSANKTSSSKGAKASRNTGGGGQSSGGGFSRPSSSGGSSSPRPGSSWTSSRGSGGSSWGSSSRSSGGFSGGSSGGGGSSSGGGFGRK